MKRITWIAATLLLVALCVPAHAGSDGKCGYDTQTCLNGFAAMKDTRGWVGIRMDKNDAGEMVIKSVVSGSPAAAAGLVEGDVLVTLNGAKLSDMEAAKKAGGEWKVGQTISYTVTHGGVAKEVSITLAKMPDDVFDAMVGEHMLADHVLAKGTANAAAKPAE
jgi:predicted metalloprotease with PDZ domain